MHELYKKYRPAKLSDVVGQDSTISQLRKAIAANKIDHAILFNGPTGTGKTTLMRILRKVLKCSKFDYTEVNTADFRGIDTIKDIRKNVQVQPFQGMTRVVGIDECHMLTKEAQNAILKLLEDPPAHAYFILGTTDPQKLLPAILGRCTEYKLRAIKEDILEKLVRDVIDKEKLVVSERVIPAITEAADGSARKALVILDAVAKEEGEDAQTRAISITTINKDLAIELARALMFPRGRDWAPIAAILQKMKEEDPEGVRYCVLGYARACMVGKEGSAPKMPMAARAAQIIDCFERNFYDSKQAGLAMACWKSMFAE